MWNYLYSLHIKRTIVHYNHMLASPKLSNKHALDTHATTGISLGMRPANERRRYIVTLFLIACVHT